MKLQSTQLAFLLAGLISAIMPAPSRADSTTNANAATSTNSTKGPVIVFPEMGYDFGKVVTGQLVKHVFAVSNAGDAPLDITSVKPGCHCTTAGDWTHVIPPGKTGTIPIQLNSAGMLNAVTRTILVRSNDKLKPQLTLTLHGMVWRPFDVTPPFPVVSVTPDSDAAPMAAVHIKVQGDQPIELFNPTSGNKAFQAALKTNQLGKDYELDITAVPKLAQNNTIGIVTVHTSLTNAPAFDITTRAEIRQTVDVFPMQIILPSRLDRALTNKISITNNTSKPLALSELKFCCGAGATLELQTNMPGRSFTLLAEFPAGYVIPGSQAGEITFKTDSLWRSVVIVPVRQFHPPTNSAVRPVTRSAQLLKAANHP